MTLLLKGMASKARQRRNSVNTSGAGQGMLGGGQGITLLGHGLDCASGQHAATTDCCTTASAAELACNASMKLPDMPHPLAVGVI